jgi:SAM-dependent methyltransferase
MDASWPAQVDAPPSWRFACPICRHALALGSRDARCAQCDRVYARSSEIWRFLPEERLAQYDRFLREYHIVREDQGWGRPDAGYFLALPQVAPDDPQRAIWRRRGETCRLLFAKIIGPMAARCERPLRILDLGAGNCWLAYRLTERGHQVAAVDLSVDPLDGIGAHVWYRPELERVRRPPLTPIQAEFDRLPLPGQSVDVALFNASLHYSTDCGVTLREALRVLSLEGAVVIMDSPVYRHAGSGIQMVSEREMEFERTYGFRSDSVSAEHFLTTDRLAELAHDLGLKWQTYTPISSVSRLKRQWRRWRGLRELAMMPVIAGKRV